MGALSRLYIKSVTKMHLQTLSVKIHPATPADPDIPHYTPLCERHPGLIKTAPLAKPGDIVVVIDTDAGTRTFGELTQCISEPWALWCWENLPDEVFVRQISERVWQEASRPSGEGRSGGVVGVAPAKTSHDVRHV